MLGWMKKTADAGPEIQAKEALFKRVGESLYRYQPTGTYYARMAVAGREVRRSLRTRDPALAKRRLAELRGDLARVDHSAGKVTLAALVDRYLATVAHQGRSTLVQKRGIAAKVKRDWPGGANVDIRKVVRSQLDIWVGKYSFGGSSRNHHLRFVRACFALAVAARLLASSPVAGAAGKTPPTPVRLIPSWQEFQAVVADIRGQVFNADARDSADFVEFIGLSGLGRAEAGALRWAHVDWMGERLTAFRHKTGKPFFVPIFPQLRPFLERIRQERGGSPPGAERVFRLRDAKKSIAGACQRLGLPAYGHRALRRTFITRAIERGVDVKVIAQWQGHSDGGKLILDTYSHVRNLHSDAMARLM